jgi:hypothetical protein
VWRATDDATRNSHGAGASSAQLHASVRRRSERIADDEAVAAVCTMAPCRRIDRTSELHARRLRTVIAAKRRVSFNGPDAYQGMSPDKHS